MKRPFVYIILLLLLGACTGREEYRVMRRGLDSISALNHDDMPFTVTDVQPYVDYFDDNGNGNDQLLAHYLLGRAYHEQGEAPMALQCYQDAVERADTTADDCDYRQLSRVYGQMADIFYQQDLFRQELIYDRLAEGYAWKGKDTLAALVYYEHSSLAYKKLFQTDSAMIVAENAARWYEECGYTRQSAIALSSTFRILMQQKGYSKLKKYMGQYERHSGLFDVGGNIEKGREIYYNIKALHYYYTQRYDSAQYWFCKELLEGKDFNNQNAGAYGLAMLYEQRHQPDSAAKYYRYAYAMNDSMYARQATATIGRMQALYDYSRHQEEAHKATVRAKRVENLIWICVAVILLMLLAGYVVYERLSRKRREMESKYLQSLEIIRQARQDIVMLKESQADNARMIAEKERLIDEQRDYLKTLPIEMPLYKRLAIQGQEPTAEEWQQIERQLFELYPQFHDFMETHKGLLNDKEYKTCILIRAGFKPKSISNMLSVGPSYISNIRTEMLQTLFNMDGTSKIFDQLIKEMN